MKWTWSLICLVCYCVSVNGLNYFMMGREDTPLVYLIITLSYLFVHWLGMLSIEKVVYSNKPIKVSSLFLILLTAPLVYITLVSPYA